MSRSIRQVLCLVVMLTVTDFSICLNNLSTRETCGYQRTDEYSRENDNISIDEFPWMVQFIYNASRPIKCSGSLINHRYVITAAHCFADKIYSITAVRLGDFNVTTDKDCVKNYRNDEECSDPVQEYRIEEKILHPEYNPRAGFNDIALVRLSKDVIFSDYVRPICLPQFTQLKLEDNQELTVSGWGSWGAGKGITTVKKKVLTNFVPYERCKKAYKHTRYPLTQFHLCASERGNHTCRGDNGGPLMLARNNQWEQVGILSFRKGCNDKFPAVYISTAHYLDWIKQNLRE